MVRDDMSVYTMSWCTLHEEVHYFCNTSLTTARIVLSCPYIRQSEGSSRPAIKSVKKSSSWWGGGQVLLREATALDRFRRVKHTAQMSKGRKVLLSNCVSVKGSPSWKLSCPILHQLCCWDAAAVINSYHILLQNVSQIPLLVSWKRTSLPAKCHNRFSLCLFKCQGYCPFVPAKMFPYILQPSPPGLLSLFLA